MGTGRPLGWVAALCLAGSAGVSIAQTTGNIDGRVSDVAGAPLPGVTVEATSPSLQRTRVAVTGSDGAYRLPALPPGRYRLAAILASFRPAEMTCTVRLDATTTVDLSLRLETEAQVLVTGEAPAIDVSSTTAGTSY
ncbi:MAG TPA: carboxypeptidase-like regulatory domain-containing protein, partial [Thermoanaerobaculia bacterium]|nr:carboxypeptidase-like regulatory domain-containing protein [Thermoanaerobaculia bacterium]